MAKLRPRARIVRTIGDQLISGPEAAVIELVKNAYDADSPYVLVKIVPPGGREEPTGCITVTDEGHGMSEEDVLDKWLEPATNEKVERRKSPAGRTMLGAKGIGRFAAARLGRWVLLQTVHRDPPRPPELTKVTVDWEWFQEKKYLEEVDIPVETRQLSVDSKKPNGVSLEIRGLREEWTERHVEVLVRELRRVVASSDRAVSGFKIRLDITAFTLEKNGFDGAELLRRLNITTYEEDEEDPFLVRPFELQKHADYVLNGTFDSNGAFSGQFIIERGDRTVQKLSIPAPLLEKDEFPCGRFSIRINVYDGEPDALEALFARMGLSFEKIGIQAARRTLSENAGIAIFRHGFRIRPYGDPENDWLELESQRVQDPSRKLGLTQMSGVIEIGDERTSGLVERSSREGLEHTGPFKRLKHLVQNVLKHAEARRFDFRAKAGHSRRSRGDLSKAREAATLPRAMKAAQSLPPKFRRSIEAAIETDARELEKELSQIDEYQQALQSRAALGLVVAEVLHEGRRLLNPVATSAKALYDNAKHVLEQTARGDVFRRQFPQYAETIHNGVTGLVQLFRRLDPISGRRRGKPRSFSVSAVVERTLDLFRDKLTEQKIDVAVNINSSIEAYGYEEDLQAALMNLIDNAAYWLSTISGARKIAMTATKSGTWITVSVSNSGPPIDDKYASQLFDAGFTLKTGGTGLGLAIAREALRRSKGDLSYDAEAAATTFIIRLRSE